MSSFDVVVTGASGFLGQAVLRQFRHDGWRALGVSRQSLLGLHQIKSYEETPEADVIIHLAEEPDRDKFNRVAAAKELQAAKTVQALCRKAGRMIYASSGVVYGDKHDAPFTTNMPVVESDQYSRSKIRNEQIVLNAGGIVLRLSNLFGSGMSKNNVLSDIMKQIPGFGPLNVISDTPIRDFLSVDDAARAFVRASRIGEAGILNVGSGVGLSVRDLAECALMEAGETQRPVCAMRPFSGFSVNVLDVAETKQILGWASESSVLDFFRQKFGNGECVVAD